MSLSNAQSIALTFLQSTNSYICIAFIHMHAVFNYYNHVLCNNVYKLLATTPIFWPDHLKTACYGPARRLLTSCVSTSDEAFRPDSECTSRLLLSGVSSADFNQEVSLS